MNEVRRPVALATAQIVDEFYRPIWRGYLAAFSLYYLFMLPTHVWDYQGNERTVMVLTASAAACVSTWGVWKLRLVVSSASMTPLLLTMNGLIVLNIVFALNINFVPEKLLYFLIIAIGFALASSSFRQALWSIGFAGLALATFTNQASSENFATYTFLAFGAAIASLTIAFLMRRALLQIASAKNEASSELGVIAEAKQALEFDLEEVRVHGEEMRKRSLTDSLTGLPNRRAFFEKIEKINDAVNRPERDSAQPDPVWLILIDLDGFKAVNDIHGHLVGDQLLSSVANRLGIFANAELFVSRVGGDEFNLVLSGRKDEADATLLCNELLAKLSEDYSIDGRRIRISGSIGCKALDQDEPVRSHIRKADFVLRTAKSRGKNQCIFFDHHHAEAADGRFRIENALREADLESELSLVFQPQFDLETSFPVRAEALLRWSSPIVGDVGPDRFIKIAEETGLIGDLTIAVVQKALGALQSWSEPIPLSINLSSHDVGSDVMIEQIIAIVEAQAINPELIEFEVTETAMLGDLEKATKNLARLANAGFSIALDDFGTGYSNFNYLRNLPISKLKIDRSFMDNPGNPMTEKILVSLAGMAKALGVHCLIEGVEDELDLLIAKRVGAGSVQGFHLGKPMNEHDLLMAFADQPTITSHSVNNRSNMA